MRYDQNFKYPLVCPVARRTLLIHSLTVTSTHFVAAVGLLSCSLMHSSYCYFAKSYNSCRLGPTYQVGYVFFSQVCKFQDYFTASGVRQMFCTVLVQG